MADLEGQRLRPIVLAVRVALVGGTHNVLEGELPIRYENNNFAILISYYIKISCSFTQQVHLSNTLEFQVELPFKASIPNSTEGVYVND